MKICINEKSIKDFNAFFKSKANELYKKNPKATLNEVYQYLYNNALPDKTQENHDVVIQHMIFAPVAISETGFVNGNIALSTDVLSFLAIKNDNSKINDFINKFNDIVNTPIDTEEKETVFPTEIEDEDVFKAVHIDILTNIDSETEGETNTLDRNKIQAFEYIRFILDELNKGEDIKLMLGTLSVLRAELKKKGLVLDESLLSKTKQNDSSLRIFIPVDSDGNFIQDERGVVAAFQSHPLSTDILYGEGSYDKTAKQLNITSLETEALKKAHKTLTDVYIKDNGLTQEEASKRAFNEIVSEVEAFRALSQKLKDNVGIIIPINKSAISYGFLPATFKEVSLTEINNLEEFNIYIAEANSKKSLMLTGGSVKEKNIILKPDFISDHQNIVNNIVEILTNDKLTFEGRLLNEKSLKLLLSNYFQVNNTSPLKILNNTKINIYNKTYDRFSEEGKEAILNFLNNFNPKSKVAATTNFIADLNDSKVNYNSVYKTEKGEFYSVYKPRFTVQNKDFNNVVISDNNITLEKIGVKEYFLNKAKAKVKLSDRGELRLYNPRIAFSVADAEFIKDFDTNVENINTDSSPIQPLINEVDEFEGLDASLDLDLGEVSDVANENALSWFLNSPFNTSRVLELNFSDVKHPTALAKWKGNAITLYQGSNNTLIYHEAWHGFTQGILTKEEKIKLYKEVRSNNPSLKSDKEAEEFLAEKFRAYMINGTVPKGNLLQQFFKAIKDFLERIFSNPSLSDKYFKQLETGNFNPLKYNPKVNSSFNALNAKITSPKSKDGKVEASSLTTSQTKLILDSVTALMGDKHKTLVVKNSYLQIKTTDDLSDLYLHAKRELVKIQSNLQKELTELKSKSNLTSLQLSEVSRINSDLEAVTFSLNNFGDLTNIKANINESNVIGVHLNNSPYTDLNALTETTTENENTNEYDKLVDRQDKTLAEMADEEILQMISLVKDYFIDFDGKQKEVVNSLGVHLTASTTLVLNKVGKLLMSKANETSMYEALKKASKKDKIIKQVFALMPKIEENTFEAQHMWSKFFQTFNKSNVALNQLSFERKIVNGKVVTVHRYGNNSGALTPVQRVLETDFNNSQSKFIGSDINGRFLNIPEFLKHYEDNKKTLSNVEVFNLMGISITNNPIIEDILQNGSEENEIPAGLLNEFINKLKEYYNSDQIEDDTLRINNLKKLVGSYPVYDEATDEIITKAGLEGYFKKIKLVEFLYSDKYNSFMGTNAEGENASELVLNSTITRQINSINEVKNLKAAVKTDNSLESFDVEKDPFKKANNWLSTMFNSEGVRDKKISISIENISGLKYFQEFLSETGYSSMVDNGTANMKLDENSKYIMDVYLSYLNKSEIPRAADKTTSLHIGLSNKETIVTASDGKEAMNTATYLALKKYLVAEIVRINTLKNTTGNFDKAYVKRGTSFFIFDGILGDTTSKLAEAIKSTDFNEVLKGLNPFLVEINDKMDAYFQNKSDASFAKRKDNFFLTTTMHAELKDKTNNPNLTKEQAIEILINMFERNKFIHNLDMTTLFLGDPALYNVPGNDFHKRLAGAISTGEVFRTDGWFKSFINSETNFGRKYADSKNFKHNEAYNDEINTGILKESKVTSVYYKHYENYIGKAAGEYADNKMKEADGQGLIGFDAYRLLQISQGIWSPIKETMYRAIVAEVTFDQSKVSEFFEPMKLQYFGPVKSNSLPLTAFHKFNLIPLIPSMIKGTKLEQLHDHMMEQNIDYVTFQSGSKLSVVSNIGEEGVGDNVYDENRNLNNVSFIKNTIHVKYLKNQVKVHSHFKGKITLPTQMRKLIESGLMNGGVPSDVLNVTLDQWKKMSEEDRQKASPKYYGWIKKYEGVLTKMRASLQEDLLSELGVSKASDLFGNSDKLVNLIRRELTRKDYSEEQISFLFNENALKKDLSTALIASQVEKLLISLVDKRLTKIKVNGEGLVQMAAAMTEKIGAVKSEVGDFVRGSNDLRMYYLKDGVIQGAQVKIALQGSYEKLLGLNDLEGNPIAVYHTNRNNKRVLQYDETLAKLNKLMENEEWYNKHRKVFRISAPRIPSQAMNSLEFFEIKEFLPKTSGSVIMLPSEIVIKSGGDFDYDKLFTMMPNISVISGSPKFITSPKVKRSDVIIEQELDNVISKINEQIAIRKNILKDKLDQKDVDDVYKYSSDIANINKKLIAFKELKNTRKLSNKEYNEKTALYEERDVLYEAINILTEGQSEKVFKTAVKEVQNKLKDVQKTLNDLYAQKDELLYEREANSFKALENELLDVIIERLEMEDNFKELIKPNSIELVDQLSKDLADKNNDTSNSRIFDPSFNIKKQIENSVGMDTLGIGAIANSYFAIFSRIGMYLNSNSLNMSEKDADRFLNNPKSNPREVASFIKYRMPFSNHNSTVINGKEVIDLSQLYNFNAETKEKEYIPDILGQLINGWVDVAKEAWIFNIQGNKEVAPTMLFAIMAGVPVKEIVYFASVPVIKNYIKNKVAMSGTLYDLMSENTNEVIEDIFTKKKKIDFINKTLKDMGSEIQIEKDNDVYEHQPKENLDISFIEKIVNGNVNGKDVVLTLKQQEDLLFHYLAMEQTANQLTALTTSTTFDTKTNSSFSELREMKRKFNDLNAENKALPEDINKLMLQDSPIGMFESTEIQFELWSNFFPLATDEIMVGKMNAGFRNNKIYSQIEPGKKSEIEQMFAGDFINYLYQNEYNNITNNKYKTKEGPIVEIEIDTTIENETGYHFVDNKFSYNPILIQEMVTSDVLGYNFDTRFRSLNAAIKFSIEEAISKTKKIDKNSVNYSIAKSVLLSEGISTKDANYKENLATVYHHSVAFLKAGTANMLLSNNPFSFSKRLVHLKSMYPELVGLSPLVKDLVADSNKYSDNLFLPNLKNKDADKIYMQELDILRTLKTIVREVNGEPKEIKTDDITDLFSMFDHFVMLQGTSSKYNMSSIIDQTVLEDVIGTKVDFLKGQLKKIANKQLDGKTIIDDFVDLFYGANSTFQIQMFKRKRGKLYDSDEYFNIKENTEGGTNFSQSQAISATIAAKEIELKPKDVLAATNSTSIIGFIQDKSNYKKTKGSYFERIYTNFYEDFIAEEVQYFDKNSRVWIIGEAEREAVGVNVIKEFQKELKNTFDTKYKPMIDRAIAEGTTVFNMNFEKGIASLSREYLKSKGFTEHVIIEALNDKGTKTESYVQMNIKNSVVVNNLYRTGNTISYKTQNNVLDFNTPLEKPKKVGNVIYDTPFKVMMLSIITKNEKFKDKYNAEVNTPGFDNLKFFNENASLVDLNEVFKNMFIWLSDYTSTNTSSPKFKEALLATGDNLLAPNSTSTLNSTIDQAYSHELMKVRQQLGTFVKDDVGEVGVGPVKVISEPYGVVAVETNPTEEKTKEFVNIIQSQIKAQAYQENKTGNKMFMYGLRWTRIGNAIKALVNKSYANKGLPTTDSLSRDGYAYDTLDQNGNPLPSLNTLQPIINEIQNSLGIDMSDYDAVIGNIYLPGQRIQTHRDTTESLSARNYPVVVYTLGAGNAINVYENEKNPGAASFASDKKVTVPTKNGTIYTFGMDGKGRFELGHDTPFAIKKTDTLPPITMPDGTIIKDYTITLTFRRAADLKPGMPASPAKIQKVEQSAQPSNVVNNPSEFTNHSGGAYGADTFWDMIGREFGVTEQKHYKDAGNANLSQKLKNAGVKATILTKEQMDTARTEVEKLLGEKYPDTLQGNLQVRNYYQVANADAVFAIAELDSSTKPGVFGGTNTAVQLGIKLGKPVYVFDLDTQKWYTQDTDYLENGYDKTKHEWNYNGWIEIPTPTLTKNFAGVGSRDIESYNVQKDGKWVPRDKYKGKEIEEAAKKAIRDVYENTFKAVSQNNTPVNSEITTGNYTKDTAPNNPDTGFIFTENSEMLGTNKNVSMTQAIIRTDKQGNKNPNALPIITKKFQVAGESGQWKDTAEDFNDFKVLNTDLINKIKSSGYKKLVFPQGFATDKAKMPTRFAEWLQKALLDNFGLVTELNTTKTGLISKSIQQGEAQGQGVNDDSNTSNPLITEPNIVKVKVFRTENTASSSLGTAQRGAGLYFALDAPFQDLGQNNPFTESEQNYDSSKNLDATTKEGLDKFMDIMMKATEKVTFTSMEERNEAIREAMIKAGYNSLIGYIEQDMPSAGRELVIYNIDDFGESSCSI
jgi:hypothetical protein